MKESTRRRQAAVDRTRRGECIGAPSGVSRAEERTTPMVRFPDSRIDAARPPSQAPEAPSDITDVSLPAYSGGTVRALHPLRMAAGAVQAIERGV